MSLLKVGKVQLDGSGNNRIEMPANGHVRVVSNSSISLRPANTETINIQTGAATVYGTLDVQGAATQNAITANSLNILQNSTQNAITANSLTVSGNSNFDSSTFFVDSVGNKVGIGTSSPTANLHVIGSSNISGTETVNVLAANTIEFGQTTDTTISRAGAGVVAVEGANVAMVSVAQKWTAQQYCNVNTLIDGTYIDWNLTANQKAKVVLGGNRTMNATTNYIEGTSYTLWLIQDSTGSRAPTWNTTGNGSFDFGTDGAPTLTTAANNADLLVFECVQIKSNTKLRFAGIKKGFT